MKKLFNAVTHIRIPNTIILVLTASFLFAQGLRYDPPKIDGYEPPFQSSYGSPFTSATPAILKNNSTMFRDTAFIDFEKRQLTFVRQDENGNAVWTYHYDELNEYINDKKKHSFYESWYEKLTDEAKKELGTPAAPRLQWELPVHYPPWAQRLLGNDPPRLKIEGRLELTAAYDYTHVKIGKDDPGETSIIPLDLVPNYEFAIRGSVGRLISVNISHSKQDGFDLGEDPLKNFKVEYKESTPGELEDEIIQEIVAGYTGFDMPGTNLSGYSEKHDGLFGIKVRAKVGPLMLTGVASHAQGEAITKELGGKNDPNSASALRENEFIKSRYFFLDPAYKDFYNRYNNITMPDRNAAKPSSVNRNSFQAFVSINCGETAQSTVRRYKADINGNEVCFKMLEDTKDYYLDADRGWVRFEHNIKDEDIVAITMTSSDASLNKGVTVPNSAANDSRQNLWVLKPHNMEGLSSAHQQYGHLFGLMWRNVYELSGIDDAKLDLFFLDPAQGDTIRHNAQSALLSRVMGLTDDQGRARIENVEIFNLARQELILPPWGPGANGNEPFANPALGGMADSAIYRFGSKTTFMTKDYVSKFGILTDGSVRRSSYDNLGWNIIQGTVTVKTNSGTKLDEGDDYEIDYQMGVIDLISARARSAESIFITYQRESDFVLEKKVFAGLRGEIKLPFISENSFAAASVLYQNAATSAEDIPQLGNEPFSKLHLSFNTSLDFQPEWMTKAVNLLPLVKSETESAAKFDFEVVHSRMNTNRAKENGAYIDDFEGSKNGYSLSRRHQNWHPSHYPFKYTGGAEGIARAMLDSLRVPAWDIYWFTPNSYDIDNLISKFSVWMRDPHNSRYTTSDTYIDILRLRATPASRDHPQEVRDRFKNSYASITTSFGRNGLNMENHRYLEMLINPKGTGYGRRGKLMVQIGTFSHDQLRDGGPPNGKFDLEDPTYQNNPSLLSQYDKGLNGRDAADKFYLIPKADGSGWDTLSRTQNTEWLVFPRSVDNPSGDRFQKYDRDNPQNYRYANGTWGNNHYDSENIDNDGIPRINITENYYSYIIDLDAESSPYIDVTARVMQSNGWRFYRIPIKDILEGAAVTKDSANGGADWSKVRGLRLVWYDYDERMLTNESELQIADFELVGNLWEPAPGSESKIEPTSISNEEDEDYYNSVYGLIVKPKAGEMTPKESSLRLRFFNLSAGETAIVRKNQANYSQNISGYDSVSVMVHSKASYGDDLKFVFRFGSDDSTYYEYSAPINWGAGWQRFAFSLQDLSDLKLAADVDNKPIDASSGNLRVVAPANKRPNFTAVTFMATGVARGQSGPVEGEIWVNELMAVGARNLSGIAARVNFATQWADFLSLAASAGYTDGDFRTMTDMPLGTENKSELFANISAKMQINKFMPEEWGVSIPVGGSVSGSLSRPTVKPQSDILLLNDSGDPDGFPDMFGDALNRVIGREVAGESTRAQRFETFSTTRNAYTSFEKTSESENPFVNFTLDRIKTDVSYNMTASYTGKGPQADPDSADYVRTDTTVTYTGNLRYDLSPRNPPEWTSVAPFEETGWMPKIYRGYTFNLLPSTISFDLAEVQHRTETRNDAKLNVHNFTTRTFDMRHGASVDYTPIDPLLNLSYSTRLDRDLSNLFIRNDWALMADSTLPNIFGLNRTPGEMWDEYWVLYGERGRTQSAAGRLTPQFFTWMTHGLEYGAEYTGMMTRRDNDSTQYINAEVGTSFKFKTTWKLNDMFKGIGKIGAGAKDAGGKDVKAKDTTAGKGFAERLSDGLTRINMHSVNFEYDAATSLKNSFLTSTYLADTANLSSYEFFKYQLGMGRNIDDYIFGNLGRDGLGWMNYRQRTGVEHDLYRFDQSMGSWTTRLSTAFVIPDPFKINFSSVSYGWGREFYGQPDSTFVDTTIVLPEIRASANTEALTRFALVKKHMSKLGLSSTASYKNIRKEARDKTDTTAAFEFQPLVSLDGKFHRWPSLSANYRYGRSMTYTMNGGKDAETGEATGIISTESSVRNSHTATLGYEFRGVGKLQEIKLWNWVFPVQGRAQMGLTVNWETLVTRTNKIGDEEDEVKEESDFNYSPFLSYKFTDNISGQARYLGSHKNQSGRFTNQQRFELTALITF